MKTELINKFSRTFGKASFKIKKYSPEILVGVGIVGVVTSTVMACKATTKLSTVLDESKEQIDQIHNYVDTVGYSEKYSENDYKKDLVIVYTQSGIKLAKLYAPSIIVGTLSLASILMSHKILKTRNVALAAAYATVDSAFKDYRKHVVDRFGEAIDRELKYNVKVQEVEKTVTDEDGNEKTVKENAFVVNPSDVSEYARFFEEYTKDEKGNVIKNSCWIGDNEHNLVFLKSMERWANKKLESTGYLFLNEVYEALGIPRTKAGQIVGWVYDKDHPIGDNYVDFGLYKDNLSYSDFVNGYDNAILLDFNVDGNIWDLM